MKVTGTPRSKSASRANDVKTASAPQKVSTAPVVDEVSIAGIPESELTPRVRETLFNLMEEVRALRAELSEARTQMKELKTLAETDPLLGVLNRRAFVKELDRALAMVERYDTPASLIFIDLNDLKKINDDLGHAAGDAALTHVAAILAGNIRQTDILGRLGGDEFGLILTQTDEPLAKAKAETLRQTITTMDIDLNDVKRSLDIACGVVALRKSSSAEEALTEADAEMYAKKRRDKGDVTQ